MVKLFRFKHFRSRILAFVLLASVPIQLLLFTIIRDANINTARRNVDQALRVTQEIFQASLSNKRDNLMAKVRALSLDYAFKPVAHTNEHQTVLSTLSSYQARADADIMLLLTLDGEIIADTLQVDLTAQPFYLPELIEKAMANEYGEADTLAIIKNTPYLLVALPLFSPEASHWVVMGFKISQTFVTALQATTKSHISIFYQTEQDTSQILASTLTHEQQQALSQQLINTPWQLDKHFDLNLKEQNFVSLAGVISSSTKHHWYVILQASLDKALAPYKRLELIIILGFSFALLLLILSALVIAKKITRPITQLSLGADEIAEGHYDITLEIDQQDELGHLAKRFNFMAKGLAERAKVRSLLGKVVSSSIAEQLLNKGVELGGEVRQVSILFSDVRNFTQLCEQKEAKQVITLLNQLLTRFSANIDEHKGVVDKYIGDAVMALFGVPIADENQAQNSVLAALVMQKELKMLNKGFIKQGIEPLALGIGINTAQVLAGNMGSQTRLNYTVLGDGVNLASRLESLTKYYQVPILVSESCKNLSPDIYFRPIDKVRVKGKKHGVSIYQPIAMTVNLSEQKKNETEVFIQAINLYREQEWQSALTIFTKLNNNAHSKLYNIYIQRCLKLTASPIDTKWDGIFTHLEK